jgi:transcriptional regulator with XRE-family HTH domain
VTLNSVLESIGANVRALRLRRGLTQEQLAERADLDLRFVQRVERGQTNLSVAVLVALSTVLEVRPEQLFKAAKVGKARVGRPPKKKP